MKYIAALIIVGFACYSTAQTTFEVDAVTPASTPMPVTDCASAIEDRIEQPLFMVPPELAEINSTYAYGNIFLETVHHSYAEHRPLALSPDDIWLTLCQAFGNHVAANSKELESRLLQANHPDKILIRNDDLASYNPDSWKTLIESFEKEVNLYAKGDVISKVNQKFTTTTPIISTTYKITVLDAYKDFFEYMSESGCGIPEITLLGTTEDWEKIYQDVDIFNEYGLEFWTAEIKPVLAQFVQASKGNADVEFWQAIYKHVSYYGTSAITGWILKFYPYLAKEEIVEQSDDWEKPLTKRTVYYPNPYIYGKTHLLSGIDSRDIPKGYVEVPFTWRDYDEGTSNFTEYNLTMCAGFVGIKQDELKLQPIIGWYILDQADAGKEYKNWSPRHARETLDHKVDAWYPEKLEFPKILPIFDPENNATAEAGDDAFKQLLLDNGFDGKGASKLEIYIAWDGSMIFKSVKGPLEAQFTEISKFINGLDKKWEPAKHPNEEASPDWENPINTPANYIWTLEF